MIAVSLHLHTFILFHAILFSSPFSEYVIVISPVGFVLLCVCCYFICCYRGSNRRDNRAYVQQPRPGTVIVQRHQMPPPIVVVPPPPPQTHHAPVPNMQRQGSPLQPLPQPYPTGNKSPVATPPSIITTIHFVLFCRKPSGTWSLSTGLACSSLSTKRRSCSSRKRRRSCWLECGSHATEAATIDSGQHRLWRAIDWRHVSSIVSAIIMFLHESTF
jgi:hypothetical protein